MNNVDLLRNLIVVVEKPNDSALVLFSAPLSRSIIVIGKRQTIEYESQLTAQESDYQLLGN